MKQLHKIGNVFVLQITRAAQCAHRDVRIINDSGDKVCLHCGKRIHDHLYPGILKNDMFHAA
ncbi:MAG: hypothetical protein K0S53_2694 [Bacteroidetes bacterium]|jgi:hypothetical protein|nr:hypothetical protein [Bacteroidota bacterium]